MKPNGLHAFLDFFGCKRKLRVSELKNIAGKICKENNLKVVGRQAVKFKGGGSTLVFILRKSHLVIHAYPEMNYFNVDLYACGKVNLKKVCSDFKRIFSAERTQMRLQKISAK